MKFILQFAWRDSRASRRRLLFFSLSIVLGVAALVAVGSFGVNLRRAVDDQANGLLGADLAVNVLLASNPDLERWIGALGGEASRVQTSGAIASFPGGDGATMPVRVIRIDGNYPFYGSFRTDPENAPAVLRHGGPVAIVDAGFLKQAHARAGERIRLGPKTYTVVGAMSEFPGIPPIAAFVAPPVVIPWAEPPSPDPTGKRDSRFFRVFVKMPAGSDLSALAEDFAKHHFAGHPGITTADNLRRNIADALTAIDRFFCLVGFVSLFLGAIGVGSTMHVYVSQKLGTVAVLRCLGLRASEAFLAYLIQGAALGVFGAALGAACGVALQFTLPAAVRDWLPFPVPVFVTWPPILIGMLAGFVICLLFTLLPLLSVRRVPPLAALRSAFAAEPRNSGDPLRTAIGGAIVLAVVGFAVWQTGSPGFGVSYAVALTISLGIFALAARAVSGAARRWSPRRMPYVVRQGVANLHRPDNRTTLLLVSIGLGTFLSLTLYGTRSTLLREFSGDRRPNLILPDVPDDAAGPVAELVQGQGGRVIDRIPIVPMTAVSVNGKPAARPAAKSARPAGREAPPGTLRASYRESLSGDEEVIAGKFIGRVEPGTAMIPISVTDRLPLGGHFLKLGDEVVWDVQGLSIRTRVASVRQNNGFKLAQAASFHQVFPVLFPEGALNAAPKTVFISVRGQTRADVARIEKKVTADFPRVRTLDIAVMIEAFDRVFAKVAFVVEFMAVFSVATGAVMLAASVVSGRAVRAREAVLLRTLGASVRQLRQIQLTEYSILGVLAALTGCILAIGANLLLAHFAFDLPPRVSPAEPLAAIVCATAITLATGLLADRGAFRQSPLEVLREEG